MDIHRVAVQTGLSVYLILTALGSERHVSQKKMCLKIATC